MVTLSRILFPILILLGTTGIVVGILNSYDRFGAFAIAPLFWNLTIIAVLVLLAPAFLGHDRIYAYAIGILAGTVVQLLIPAFDLRNTPFRFTRKIDWRDPNVRRVLLLMLPVTISLGLINFNLLINSFFGSLVDDRAPAAIDKAFRIYQLPQGIFSVAIATVLFPTLARFAARGRASTTCARRWPTGCARSSSSCCRRRPPCSSSPSRWSGSSTSAASSPPRRPTSSRRRSSGSPSRCRRTASSCC